jgi:hypothetical protein
METPSLDAYLSDFTTLPQRKKSALNLLREAYTYGVPGIITKSMTDRLAFSGQYAFHIGTPDPEMRRIASWMLTVEPNRKRIARLIPKIWKRHGREDLKLVGLLLANMSDEELGEDCWTILLQLIQDKIAVEAFLEIAEELGRGGRSIPTDSWIIDASKQSNTWCQLMILILSIDESRCLDHLELIKTAPQEGELFERIRSRLLERIS